jgi:hypothetical protein
MLSVTFLNVILIVNVLSVAMLSDVRLIVVAPKRVTNREFNERIDNV